MTASESTIRRVTVNICENCINGAPGQCHAPGCLFCRFRIDETPQPLKYLLSSPRVFLDGETVPAGVCVLTEEGEVRYLDDTGDCRHFCEIDDREPGELCKDCSYETGNGNLGALVEVILPDYWESVEYDRAFREETSRIKLIRPAQGSPPKETDR